jgi:hypothetical protein
LKQCLCVQLSFMTTLGINCIDLSTTVPHNAFSQSIILELKNTPCTSQMLWYSCKYLKVWELIWLEINTCWWAEDVSAIPTT